jgi:hypothetical protein
MAYFSNGSEGDCFYEQCMKCKYGQYPCPIAFLQMEFNYDQLKDTTGTARKMLDALVRQDGTCTMFETFKADLRTDNKPMFPELLK